MATQDYNGEGAEITPRARTLTYGDGFAGPKGIDRRQGRGGADLTMIASRE